MSNGQVPANVLAQFSISSNLCSKFMASLGVFDQEMLALCVHDEISTKVGGLRIVRAPNLNRDSSVGHEPLMKDYLVKVPVYGEHYFGRRFCMSRALFVKKVSNLGESDVYFTQKNNVLGKLQTHYL